MPETVPEEPAPEPALLKQETALTASSVSLEEMIPVQGSASKHKLSMFLDSGSTAEGSDKGYLTIDAQLLQMLFQALACPKCDIISLQLQVCHSLNLGFVQKMRVLCISCRKDISLSCSLTLLEDRCYDLNRRVVASSLVVLLGPEELEKLCPRFTMRLR